jgi:uncharacterized repeat protein (TIGR03803 family)
VKNLFYISVLIAGLGLLPAGSLTAQTFTNLHSFTGIFDGSNPDGRLVISRKTLYGTTTTSSTVFAVNTDGTGYMILHNFTNGSDGYSLYAGLTLSGNPGNFILYGTAVSGGDYLGKGMGAGTVFALIPVNSPNNLTVSHVFTDGWDGGGLFGGVILSGDTLYGTAQGGGTNGTGTIFGTTDVYDGLSLYGGEEMLHTFTKLSGPVYTNSDGAYPESRLVLFSNTLYGTTSCGRWGNGTVFAVNTDGTGFTNLYNFSADINTTNSDGAGPTGELILSGNTLYGTASDGGSSGNGTVFAVNTDGTSFTNLESLRNVTLTV